MARSRVHREHENADAKKSDTINERARRVLTSFSDPRTRHHVYAINVPRAIWSNALPPRKCSHAPSGTLTLGDDDCARFYEINAQLPTRDCRATNEPCRSSFKRQRRRHLPFTDDIFRVSITRRFYVLTEKFLNEEMLERIYRETVSVYICPEPRSSPLILRLLISDNIHTHSTLSTQYSQTFAFQRKPLL